MHLRSYVVVAKDKMIVATRRGISLQVEMVEVSAWTNVHIISHSIGDKQSLFFHRSVAASLDKNVSRNDRAAVCSRWGFISRSCATGLPSRE